MYRTELSFGMKRMDGGAVTPAEFSAFERDVIAARLPGATVTAGHGVYRTDAGETVREACRVLTVVHDGSLSRVLESIAAEYCQQFDQESVLITETRARVQFFRPAVALA